MFGRFWRKASRLEPEARDRKTSDLLGQAGADFPANTQARDGNGSTRVIRPDPAGSANPDSGPHCTKDPASAPFPQFPHYKVERVLGAGGMGVVYAALDERLGRHVAIKTLHTGNEDPNARERLWREARIGAGLNHPNVCRIYEIGEIGEEPYLVMELLEGESLAHRIARSPLPPDEACTVALGILEGLDALHSVQGVHRDLKPSNVILAPHGVKLLDFGLARGVVRGASNEEVDVTVSRLTTPGMILGTPRYMAPEQLSGEPVDARTDIFAAGAVLFEMLTGRPAFAGDSPMEAFHAVMFEQPPALAGSDTANALSRIIQRALVKRPEQRYPSARLMADDLRKVHQGLTPSPESAVRVRPVSRLLVLPFRILRPDPDTDYLAASLPEAISSALSDLDSLVVRSSWFVPPGAGNGLDLKQIAAEAEVDLVLTGSLLAQDGRIRVHTQLLEAPSGNLVWSYSSEASTRDAFRIEEELIRRIVESLALPLSEREERMLRRDIPASPTAYELFLRGNQQSHAPEGWRVARELFQRCLEEDPRYAPAWVRLARTHFLLGKYTDEDPQSWVQAEGALQRALELNPDLAMAHQLYAQVEVTAGRALDALRRLLGRVQARPNDPDLFSGLVLACRFCGLLEASLAAHRQARALDPKARTSVAHTYFMLGRYEEALAESGQDIGYMDGLCLVMLGRSDEARARLGRRERNLEDGTVQRWVTSLRAMLDGEVVEAHLALEGLERSFHDPEGHFYVARAYTKLGDTERALALLERSTRDGFTCQPALSGDPWFAPLREHAAFREIEARARVHRDEAVREVTAMDGWRSLGIAAEPLSEA